MIDDKPATLDDGSSWRGIRNMMSCVERCNDVRIRDKKEIEDTFSRYAFELDYDFLSKERRISDYILFLLCEWLEKYQCNMKGLYKLRMEYKHWLLYAHELPADDPRHEDIIGGRLYPKDDAPEEARRLADMENDFAPIESYLPHIEFTGEYLMS